MRARAGEGGLTLAVSVGMGTEAMTERDTGQDAEAQGRRSRCGVPSRGFRVTQPREEGADRAEASPTPKWKMSVAQAFR